MPVSKILVVDDDAINRRVLEVMLKSQGHEVACACSGREALEAVDGSLDLMLLDVMMPEMDGFDVVRRIRADARYHELPVIMVTALTSLDDRLRAVECGANDFIAKPIDRTELRARTLTMLKMKEAQDAIKRHQANLESIIEQRTAELRSALTHVEAAKHAIQDAHLDTVRRLAIAAEHRDEGTATHIYRVGAYCQVLAGGLGLDPQESENLRHASFLHDVGKIAIPDAILLKRGPLTKEEYVIMKQHTLIGAEILEGSNSDLLQVGHEIALTHHERWDGSGYPNGIAGERIPLYGRICAVADVFDALMSERPYKPAFSLNDTLEIMRNGRGTHFDPQMIDTFLANIDSILAARVQYAEENAQRQPLLHLWKTDKAA